MAALAVSPAMADFTDNFSSGSLSLYDQYSPLSSFGAPAGYTFVTGGLQISAPQSPAPGTLGPGRAGLFVANQTYNNLSLSYDILAAAPGTSEFAGAFVQVGTPGLGSLNAYAVGIDYSVNALFISKVVGESSKGPIGAAAAAPFTAAPGDVLTVQYTTINGVQSAVLWDKTTGALLANVSGTDTSYTSGQVGLGVALQSGAAGLNASVTFGNFVVTAVPEPTTWALGAVGLGAMALAVRRARN